MEFDESRMIDAEHAEDARKFIGKRVVVADYWVTLMQLVTDEDVNGMAVLVDVRKSTRLTFPFVVSAGEEGWRYVYLLEDLPKPKKDTPLNRVLEKEGRRLVVAGYCCLANCSECAIRDVCRGGWGHVEPDSVNKAYEILTKEIKT
jgi:hypothetical protein